MKIQFKIQLLFLIIVYLFSTKIDFCYAQFKINYEVSQFFEPLMSIDNHGRTFIAVTSGADTVRIKDNIFFPKIARNKGFSRKTESFIAIYNDKNQLTDTIHFYGFSIGITISAIFAKNNNFYFILRGPDTIFQDQNLFINPYINSGRPNYIFHYDLDLKKLNLCKVIGNAFESAELFVDDNYIYAVCNFGSNAYVDSLVIKSLSNNIHELDILIIKMNKLDYKLVKTYPVLGYNFNYPVHITADSNQNIYFCAYVFSPKLIYQSDTLSLVGNGLLVKFSKDGNLDWYRSTNGAFLESIINPDLKVNVIGSYNNLLKIDGEKFENLPLAENGFIVNFNNNGNHESIKAFTGNKKRSFNLIKNDLPNNLIVAGQFDGEIDESANVTKQSKGAKDCFIYLITQDGNVNHSFYFQGDSTEYIVDISLLDNGHIMVLGYTFSDTLICRKDTLFTNTHNKTYFIYEIKADQISSIDNGNIIDSNIISYPSPFRDVITIDCTKNENFIPKMCTLLNQSGAIIQTYKFNGPKNTINIEFLPTGLYFLQLNNSKGEIHIIKINKI